MLVEKAHQKRQWFHLVLLLVFLIIAVLAAIYTATLLSPSNDSSTPAIKEQPRPVSVSSKVLFLGNTFWGRYVNDWSKASSLGYAYPFSRLNEFNREQYNAWISGIECPITSGVDPSSSEQEADLKFNCRPEYLQEAAKWFTAFTLANNHTDNQWADGFTETKQQLESAGVQYFGHYDYSDAADACEVIALPVNVANDDGSSTTGKLPVAMCGYHGVFGIPTDEAVAQIANYAPYMPVIAMPHMGAEYQSAPDEIKINFYHKLIDAGADMVLGDHPHWIQNTESYNGHLIVYSMGNFIFDQQYGEEVTRSAGISLTMTVEDADKTLLSDWLVIGEGCSAFKDKCLADAKSQALSKLPIKYQFSVIGTNDADKIAKPATSEQLDAILQRLDWQNAIKGLESPYSGL